MAAINPQYNIPFQNGTAVALSQPLFISGDGFFAYSPGYNTDWTQYSITPSVKLNAVDYNDKDIALFAGNNGVIVTFNKNNLTINTNVLDPNINFNNVSFYSSNYNKAVAIGDSGSVYKTENAGLNWSKLTLPANVTASLRGLTVSSSVWYMCGDKGTILSSSNEGSSWYEYNQFRYWNEDSASDFPISNYSTYNFNDIKFQSYESNGSYDNDYDAIYVVGNSGSVFINSPNHTWSGGPVPIDPSQWFDMSLFRMTQTYNWQALPQNSSQTSSVYVKIAYINEWYDTGSAGGSIERPTNFGVIGSNGEIYIYNSLTPNNNPTRKDTPSFVTSGFGYPYTASLLYSGSPISASGGGIYSLVYSNIGAFGQTGIFYERVLLVTTNDGKLIQFGYPADNDFDNISQTTTLGNFPIIDSFGGAITDLDLPTDSALYNNAFVKLGLDKPFPAKSDYMMYGITPTVGAGYLTQGMRLYRSFPSENFVTFTDSFPDGVGLIIPENYNKDLNYIEIAQKAGLI